MKDWPILICILLLCGFGSSIIASVAADVFPNQLLFYIVGLILFFIFSKLDYRIYESLDRPIYLISLILLSFTLLLGLESHGAVRWIAIGSFRLQFSELIKPFLVLSFASFLSKINPKNFRSFLSLFGAYLVLVFLVFKQPDLGSAVVYFFSLLIMIFISEINLYYLLFLALPTIIFAPLSWKLLASYQRQRLITFFQPQHDPLGASYNAIQAVITVGSGMFLGRGLGRGTQSHLLFLPERHTDFIFASVAEEFGFVGSAALLFVYLFLIWRIYTLAFKAKDQLARLIGTGLGSLLLVQVVINIGMNIGLLPLTGITLPLVSYGGSSLLATMISLGVIANISSSLKGQ